MFKKTLTGKVLTCKAEKRKPGKTVRDITRLEIIPDAQKVLNINTQEIVFFKIEDYLENAEKLSSGELGIRVNLDGIHRVDAGEKIKVNYQTHSGVNWGNSYEILNREDRVIFSCDYSP